MSLSVSSQPVDVLATDLERLSLVPTPSNQLVGIVAQYLPVKEIESQLVELGRLFQCSVTLTTQAFAFHDRAAEKLQLEMEEWGDREKRAGRAEHFEPSRPIRQALSQLRMLDSFDPFFQRVDSISLGRMIEVIQAWCPLIESVKLTACTRLGGRVLQQVAKFKKLRKLHIDAPRALHPSQLAPVSDMTSLTHLELQANRLDGKDLKKLVAPLQKLAYLKLNTCKYISAEAVRDLFFQLPHLTKVDVSDDAGVFPWSTMSEPPIILPRGYRGPFLTESFFAHDLGKQAVQYASAFAAARGVQMAGRAYLEERIKNSQGYCRGHSFALIIAHCKMVREGVYKKYNLVANKIHIQFFQALEYLKYPKVEAPLTREEENATLQNVHLSTFNHLKELASLSETTDDETYYILSYSSPTFWPNFWSATRDAQAHIVELILRTENYTKCHSIVLFFKPKFVVADLVHGICEYDTRAALELNLCDYLMNFKSDGGESLETVEILTLQNPKSTVDLSGV